MLLWTLCTRALFMPKTKPGYPRILHDYCDLPARRPLTNVTRLRQVQVHEILLVRSSRHLLVTAVSRCAGSIGLRGMAGEGNVPGTARRNERRMALGLIPRENLLRSCGRAHHDVDQLQTGRSPLALRSVVLVEIHQQKPITGRKTARPARPKARRAGSPAIETKPDGSALIKLNVTYTHPSGRVDMTESRVFKISAVETDGND